MKTKFFLPAVIALMTALVFQSCNKNQPADAGAILATIPSDVSMVAVVNSARILENAGCKINEESITPGKELSQSVEKIKDAQMKGFVKSLINGESGIDPSVLVIFREGYYTYLTGVISNTTQFKKNIAEHAKASFVSHDGIESLRNVAVSDNRFWINLTGNTIDINSIRHFTTISESQSFLQNPYAVNLTSVAGDLAGWGNISGLMNTGGMDFQNRAAMQMAIQAMFEDASAFCFTLNSSKGEIKLVTNVLNSKGKNAKYLLPSEKVDVAAIASIGGVADGVIAMAIPGKLIGKLQKDTKSNVPSLISIYLQQLGCIDGTCAFAFGAVDPLQNFRGIISTNGKDTSALSSFLSGMDADVKVNGSQLNVSKGNVSGKAAVAEMAESFKGAIGGCVTYTAPGGFGSVFESESVMIFSEGSGLRLEVKGNSINKNENPVISLLNL